MSDFIQKLKAKPIHVRENIALGTAIGVTALVTIVWITGTLTSTGLFAPMLSPSVAFEKNQQMFASVVTARGNKESSDLVGATIVATEQKGKQTPRLQIVEVSHSFQGPATSTEDRTVIPF
ncbi:MAG TPA: hypothetical protein ENJ75_01960 [Candidatus Kaiserbacteria bacterium]|nr:hypothetical protein [Candidatus Kaiserbacteria bacterium]